MHKMFGIFRNEGEPMANNTQVCKLFRRIQHPQLQYTVKAIEFRADIDGIAYSEVANYLTSAVSNIP